MQLGNAPIQAVRAMFVAGFKKKGAEAAGSAAGAYLINVLNGELRLTVWCKRCACQGFCRPNCPTKPGGTLGQSS